MKKGILQTGFMLGLLAAVLAANPPRPNAAAAESQQMRRRIDALLKPRRSPPPLPLDPPNPFAQVATTGAGVTASGANVPGGGNANAAVDRPAAGQDDANATSTEQLARFASRLKITGLIRLKDQVHVIINDTPWREGDFIIVDRSSRIIQLQVVRIQPGSLTLRLDDAELVLRF